MLRAHPDWTMQCRYPPRVSGILLSPLPGEKSGIVKYSLIRPQTDSRSSFTAKAGCQA
jgi:hypothetical protein